MSKQPSTSKKIPLDNTSSVIVALSRRAKKASRMAKSKPFEVRFKDVIIGCDTAEDAALLAKQLGNASETPWRMDEFMDFVNRIQVQQRRLLNALMRDAQHTVIPDYQLRGELGLSSNQALAGVLSGITKVAQAMEIEPKRIYGQDVSYKQGLPERRYWATPSFRKAAQDADWPSFEDLQEAEEDPSEAEERKANAAATNRKRK